MLGHGALGQFALGQFYQPVATALSAKSAVAVAGKTSPTGKVGLSVRATVTSTVRSLLSAIAPNAALVASVAISVATRCLLAPSAALRAASASTARSKSAATGVLPLQGKAQTTSNANGRAIGIVALLSRATAAVAGRSIAGGALALAARAQTAATSAGTAIGRQLLLARAKISFAAATGYSLALALTARGLVLVEKSTGGTGNDQYTKILLHGDGANSGTSIIDSNAGGSAHAWTAHGAAVTSTTPTPPFGTASLSFNGAASGGDNVSTPHHTDFDLGSNDWTIDFWLNCTGGYGAFRAVCGTSDEFESFQIYINAGNGLFAEAWSTSGGPVLVSATTLFNAPGFHHLAFVRTGNVLKLFIDGTQQGGNLAFTTPVLASTGSVMVGAAGIGFTSFTGCIKEFRLSNGIARWTANFTPPARSYERATPSTIDLTGVAAMASRAQAAASSKLSAALLTMFLQARSAVAAVANGRATGGVSITGRSSAKASGIAPMRAAAALASRAAAAIVSRSAAGGVVGVSAIAAAMTSVKARSVGTLHLAASSFSSVAVRGPLSASAALLGRSTTISAARSSVTAMAALAGHSVSRAAASASARGSLALGAIGTVVSIARGHAVAAMPLLARAAVAVRSSAGHGVAVVLRSRTAAMVQSSATRPIVNLALRATAAISARAGSHPTGVMGLVARSFARLSAFLRHAVFDLRKARTFTGRASGGVISGTASRGEIVGRQSASELEGRES